MILLVFYAFIVCYGAMKYRRRVAGFASVVGGLAGIALLCFLHWRLNIMTHGRIYLPVLQAVMLPFGALLALMGFFIAALPRAHERGCCNRCGYDLTGIEDPAARCPECGTDAVRRPLTRH